MEIMHLCLFVMMCVDVHASSLPILHRQKRNWIIESFDIDEGYKGPIPYSLGPIKVEKNIRIFEIHGQGYDEEPKGVFQINKRTGELTVHRTIDFEQYKNFTLTFQAFRENRSIDTKLGIEITIKDSNDNPPLFESEKYENSIKESKAQGTKVVTVFAKDRDTTKEFRTFDLRIVSVTPKPSDLEFYLTQNDDTGSISFKGCLDHEKAEKYTIIVEAKDHGEIPLSSSCSVVINIEDGNNHLPVITGQTGSKRVKEGEKNVLVSRLQVLDEDTNGSSAWRAKYTIQGDSNSNFEIRTDPETNDGLLYVIEPLDYEQGSVRNVTVSVDNDIPYYSCKVLRRTTTGLWNVHTVGGSSVWTPHEASSINVTVTVEDVNEPPVFEKDYKKVIVAENVDTGKYLETFTATDNDFGSKNKVVYKKGKDPADWVVVDPVTGKITTKTTIDRESSFVNGSIYEVTIYAVDNGQPPLSATATLHLYVTDQNDNAPYLGNTTIYMCQSDGPSISNITAFDPDGHPYGGPFVFKLLGDVKGKWTVEPEKGYSVNLVKEPTVHSGHHELMMEVSDSQGKSSVHSFSVTVCKCSDVSRPNCYVRRSAGLIAPQALGIVFFTLLLFAGILLLAFLMSCKRQKFPIKYGESEQHLMKSNMEHKGNDCMFGASQGHSATHNRTVLEERSTREDVTRWSMRVKTRQGMSSTLGSLGQHRRGYEDRYNIKAWEHRINSGHYDALFRETMLNTLAKGMYKLQAPGEELGHYDPRVYAEEGVMESNYQLDAISMPDISFDPDLYRGLEAQFSTLTSICFPNAKSKQENHLNHVKTQSSEVSRITNYR
ncbi:cadherin-13-like isoform X2 [Sphaeramia orbicularis]|uniref:cadherin-13-like isoform X2 n=1 Tax=Sphaeramia orbicularis TaxID=375764 RepID=UPI00117ED3EF|nr:cadherin-13-like isoform X2 [Sphaeramia orbicularis]